MESLEEELRLTKSELNHLSRNDAADKDEIADSFVELGEAVRKLETELMLGLREMRQNQTKIQGQFREIQSNLDRVATGLRGDYDELSGRLEAVEREDRRDMQAVEGLGVGLRRLTAGLGKVQAELYTFQLSKRLLHTIAPYSNNPHWHRQFGNILYAPMCNVFIMLLKGIICYSTAWR
jgi:hypothetical protein